MLQQTAPVVFAAAAAAAGVTAEGKTVAAAAVVVVDAVLAVAVPVTSEAGFVEVVGR